MATALQAESSQRNRVSGVSRRSRARSCKSDAGMLVAWTLAGKISLTPRFARRCRCLRHACARREMPATFGETILHLRSRSNRVCRTNHPSVALTARWRNYRSFACYVLPHLLCRFAVRRCLVHGAERADRPFGSRIRRCLVRQALWNKVPPRAPALALPERSYSRTDCSCPLLTQALDRQTPRRG